MLQLTSGNEPTWVTALLRATCKRWERCGQTLKQGSPTFRQMEAETYSNDPAQHTDMATLQRINQATLMQLRAQQDANQIAQAAALQQIVSQKQQQDALKAAFQDAAEYQQQYSSTVQPLTSGYGNSHEPDPLKQPALKREEGSNEFIGLDQSRN